MLSKEERDRRSKSFGAAADLYDRFRPRPPASFLAWAIGDGVERIVDIGAGTGVATASLATMVTDVIAVEPDDEMRAILEARLPSVRAFKGTGEQMPLPDSSVDAVVASTSWHWVEPSQGLNEVARVLRPGGSFTPFWIGLDPDGAFLALAAAALSSGEDSALSDQVLDQSNRIVPSLIIPDGAGFTKPEPGTHHWTIALTADELLGLLGTFSWILLMEEGRRQEVFVQAKAALTSLGIEGDVTVEVEYVAEGFKATRL